MSREPKLLRKFNSVIEAQLAQSFLESYGIASYLLTDDVGGFHPHLQQSLGVRLMVSGEDEEEAIRLLETNNESN